MRYLVISLLLCLTACSTTVPVKQKFPDATQSLMEKCPALITVEGEKVNITELLKTVVKNYTLYHECAIKTESWQEWYKIQKQIFDEVNK